MKEYAYIYNESANHYALTYDGEIIQDAMPEVGLCLNYDANDPAASFILKHGRPENVENDFAKRRKSYAENNLDFAVDALFYIQGRFDPEKLTNVINGTSIQRFLDDHGITLVPPTQSAAASPSAMKP